LYTAVTSNGQCYHGGLTRDSTNYRGTSVIIKAVSLLSPVSTKQHKRMKLM